MAYIEVVTSAASTLDVQLLAGSNSFSRNVTIVEAIGLNIAAATASTLTSSSHPSVAGLARTIAGVAAGSHAFAMAVSRRAGAQSCLWSGSFAGGDEVSDFAISGNSCASAAIQSGAASGDFTATPTFNFSDGSGQRASGLLILGDL